ncbi:Holliday junction ATP-dependent DNA helicase RuvB [Methylorubrum populi]|uniref:Holliday junction ATP-dependent DNA helicase RuvB n=1 Tax=Methylorubrum populi TaxID=223967 RepID=A0A833IZV3_9HYPH|nr:Holliday junction ATP-dependent DNA helicase RuvB [Methylorubrum populi]
MVGRPDVAFERARPLFEAMDESIPSLAATAMVRPQLEISQERADVSHQLLECPLLSTPLRDRFGIPVRLEFYSVEELELVVTRAAGVFGIGITPEGANEVVRRARGTPRIAGRLLRRVRDCAVVAGAAAIDRETADRALAMLDVDDRGLDRLDRRYLGIIAEAFAGGPVGVETIAAALAAPRLRAARRPYEHAAVFDREQRWMPEGTQSLVHAGGQHLLHRAFLVARSHAQSSDHVGFQEDDDLLLAGAAGRPAVSGRSRHRARLQRLSS